ncbi:MAG: sulfurtransferase complex subunit TusB [Gammaproteobacteria bacterium]|nr:MAG: sulfurtransferase complex subunit TusB [Gammaproteobacteria bacterium]
MTLHLIARSIETNELVTLLNACIQPGDTCLFIQSGVYQTLNQQFDHLFVSLDTQEVDFAVLTDHVLARGLADLLAPTVRSIDYPEFVKLSADHEKCITW